MKHLNLELEKLEERIATWGVPLPLPSLGGTNGTGSHATGSQSHVTQSHATQSHATQSHATGG